ncbi:MAG: flavin reductase family protein [Candidatus Competibacteraceae bacterium]|nr:flavin reductase family protein [Candidatus Competibacteraceae bacterium]
MIKTFIPSEVPTPDFHGLVLASIAPRPIAFVSTIDHNGLPNLAPYSFFNVFGVNPPLLIFSPSRRVRGNTTKHTLENVEQVKEAVINVVNFDMVQQMSLTGAEYEKGVNEFEKSGLTPLPSLIVKPFRVKESPVQIECKVRDIIYTGNEGGAGNLVICEIVAIHAHDSLFDEKGQMDTRRLDLVGRLGADWYVRASGDALFELPKPSNPPGIGIDALPSFIKNNDVLTGNDLGALGNLPFLPSAEEADAYVKSAAYQDLLQNSNFSQLSMLEKSHYLISQGMVKESLLLLMSHSNS